MKFLQEAVLGRVKYVKVPGGMKDEIRQEELYFALPKNLLGGAGHGVTMCFM